MLCLLLFNCSFCVSVRKECKMFPTAFFDFSLYRKQVRALIHLSAFLITKIKWKFAHLETKNSFSVKINV